MVGGRTSGGGLAERMNRFGAFNKTARITKNGMTRKQGYSRTCKKKSYYYSTGVTKRVFRYLQHRFQIGRYERRRDVRPFQIRVDAFILAYRCTMLVMVATIWPFL